jgi:hypothetical protein
MAVGFDVVQDDCGLHDRGCASRAAAQFGHDIPGLECGDGAFAKGADAAVVAVDGLPPPG